VKRVIGFLGLLLIAAACGGRTTLDDTDTDASAPPQDGSIPVQDSGPILIDGGPIEVDATLPPPLDAGPPPLPDSGPPPEPIQCGTTTCDPQTQVCCVTFNGQNVNETCTNQGQCNGASLSCTSASSCPPNEVCCATLTQQQQSSQCASQCAGGFQNPQLCASSTECPKGQTCQNSPFGLKVCRP
jgi:hypothetical protein